MKRQLLFIVLMSLPMAVMAEAIRIDGIYYHFSSDTRQAEVTGTYNDYSGDVVIPATIDFKEITYDVTSIGEKAFFMCAGLTSVNIPSSVGGIGQKAFSGCTALKTIVIPEGVTSLSDELFKGCSNLTSITIPTSVTSIGSTAFSGCTAMMYITIPASVTSIGEEAFKSCTSLLTFSIPEGVTSIAKGTFMYCNSLYGVTIPTSVTTIEDQAFSYCNSLYAVTIPTSVTSIGDDAFSMCIELKNVYCLAKKVPMASSTVFVDTETETSVLHVPSQSVKAYETTNPWNEFGTIVGDATDIDEVHGTTPNVQPDAIYNLYGQRVNNPVRGLYIVNGRKVVMK